MLCSILSFSKKSISSIFIVAGRYTDRRKMSTSIKPLSGVKVVEIAGLAPVPLCGQILADFGAEVTLVSVSSYIELLISILILIRKLILTFIINIDIKVIPLVLIILINLTL